MAKMKTADKICCSKWANGPIRHDTNGSVVTVMGENDSEGPANIEEGVSVHLEEDGQDLVVREAAQSSWIQVTRGKTTGVTLKGVESVSEMCSSVHF